MTVPAAIEDVLALSPLQEGLFTLARLSGDAADPYVIQFVADINGPVDVALLQRSADAVLERHPNLRVSFWDRDVPRPVQIVPSRFEIPWEFRSAAAEELVGIAGNGTPAALRSGIGTEHPVSARRGGAAASAPDLHRTPPDHGRLVGADLRARTRGCLPLGRVARGVARAAALP